MVKCKHMNHQMKKLSEKRFFLLTIEDVDYIAKIIDIER